MGWPYWGFPDFGRLGSYRLQVPNQLLGTQGGSISSAQLGSSVPGPPGYDCYGRHNCSVLYQQAERDSFAFPAMFSSGTIPVTSIPGHTHQGHTHSGLSQCNSRPPVSAKSTNNDRMYLQDVRISGSGHVCHSPQQHPTSPVHVSDSRASSTGNRCTITTFAGTVDVHISSISLAEQSHSKGTYVPSVKFWSYPKRYIMNYS